MQLADYILCVIIAVAIVLVAVGAIYQFMKLPKSEQISNLKEWLKYAVTVAEKEFGSGTGALKLRYVYELAVEKFPTIMKLVSFENFSCWVDEALTWLDSELSASEKIANYVAS